MTYLISFDIYFASDYTSDSMSTASFSVFTAGKDKNIRSVTVTAYMSVEQSVPRGGGKKKKPQVYFILDY